MHTTVNFPLCKLGMPVKKSWIERRDVYATVNISQKEIKQYPMFVSDRPHSSVSVTVPQKDTPGNV